MHHSMAILAYHASQEQFAPSHLLKLAVLAETAGFGAIHSSDHFHPWSERQGQSGFTFGWLGAAMQATRLPFSMVCAPGQRLHPAIIAQAVATLAELFPGRFSIELGSGEFLNEHITGEGWPGKEQRNTRLVESAMVMRRLLRGEEVSFKGQITVDSARLYSLPPTVPLLFGAAISSATARWLGSWADGLLTTVDSISETAAKVEAFRAHGGAGKPVYLQMAFCYGRNREETLEDAWDQWRSNMVGADKLASLAMPRQFDAAAERFTVKEVANALPYFSSVRALYERVRQLEEAVCPERIILHLVNRWQERFIEEFAVQ